MRYKSAIIWLSTIISALCIFFLSFTWKSNQLKEQAIKYATSADGKVDAAKRLHFIDSLWKQPVYIGYTLQEVTQYALQKGLDLEGGLHAVLEVSPVEILRALSGKSNDPNFEKALAEANAAQANSSNSFNDLFYDAFAKVAPNQTLASVFANSVNRGKISSSSSDSEVKKVIDAEIDGAVDRVYKIIQARIDKFGVANPNIQRLPGSNRIQVELPGVDNPERARKLLSGAAKLEFVECYDLNEYGGGLNALGALLDKEAKAPVAAAPAAAAPATTDTAANALANKLAAAPAKKDSGKAKADTSAGSALTKLFLPLGNNIGVYVKDTARVNALFARADVKAMFPANLTFAWAAKGIPAKNGDEILSLEALKKGEGQSAPLEGDVITDAAQDFDQAGRAEVTMAMNGTGARIWKNLTGANIGRRIAIVLDGYVYSAPVINGEILETSEISIVSENQYRTNGEECVIIRNVQESTVILDSKTTDHVVVKSMTHLTIKPDTGRIDEDYDEIVADKYACIEFRFCAGSWYIISSDGLKNS